ncbi:MAG TPA: pitrilysin family protein [Vicinamibacterales bacterium]|nr:pitrilysin family protein [Vicinamibacterales bacterium]
MRNLIFRMSILFLLAAAAASAQQAPQRVTSVEGITEYTLSNGLRVLLFPDPSKPTVTVNITYLVGSAQEGYGETGMAHLLEHLQFKGTPRHGNIPQELTEHGARTNATTWLDRTNYFETLPATDSNLQWALGLEADRMVNSFIAKKDLDSEMTVVRNEFERGENDPSSVLEERVLSTAFLWHNYGHSTIGARSDIEHVPIDRLQAFYHRFYQPDNAVLLLAGRFDEPKTLALIQTLFGAVPKPERELAKIYTQEPVQDGERSVTLRRAGDIAEVLAGYHIPAGSHPDIAPLDVLMHLLSDSPSGRLYTALVETKKAARIGGSSYRLRDPGYWLVGADTRKEQSLEEAERVTLATLDALVAQPATAAEVDRAKAAILKNIELGLNDATRVGLQMSEWIAQGDWRLFFIYRDRIRAVTPADVNRVAQAYLKPSNRTIGLFVPTDKPDRSDIPVAPPIDSLVKDYKGDPAVAAGEAFDPSPVNIEQRVKRIGLPNSIQVALLPKKTRGGSVVVHATFRFGDEKSLFGRTTDASMAGAMLMRGSTAHTRQQIREELDRLKARANLGGGATQATLQIETVRDNLPATLTLMAEILRSPAFAPAEFDSLKQARLASIEESRAEPQAIAATELDRHLHPYPKGDVRYRRSLDEEVADMSATTVEKARQFYQDFYGATNAQFAVVGDFDEAAVMTVIRDRFVSWKSPKPYARVPSLYTAAAPLSRTFETPDKTNAVFMAAMNIPLRDDEADYPALVMANFMFGGGFLNSRLATRLRQKEGLSYGVGSQLQVSSLDKQGTFGATAIYAPQNAAKLETAFKEELTRVLRDGFTQEELDAARTGWLQSRTVTRSQDGSVATRLAEDLYLERTYKRDTELENNVAALTAAQVNTALRKYVSLEKVSIFKAGDFGKTAQ